MGMGRNMALAVAITALPCLPPATLGATLSPTFEQAQHLFYNGDYEAAAALALELREPDQEDLASYELRTSALLFQMKRLLAHQPDKAEAFKQCATCPDLLADFLKDTVAGQRIARARLLVATDDETLFMLGKLDLNFVWMQLDPLGKRAGWSQYWEARRSLDAVLQHDPMHVRARVARAWIDYIVHTKAPGGTRWILGGGNKDRALKALQQAADTQADFFANAEARFALWEMQVREKRVDEAVELARSLARDFPENRQLAAFLEGR